MAFINVATGGSEIKLIDKGVYDAVLIGILDYGIHMGQHKGKPTKPNNLIKLVFEIPSLTIGEGDKQVTRTIGSKEMPAIFSDRSNFFKTFKAMGVLSSVNNVEEQKVFETKEGVNSLLGKAVSLTINHFKKSDGGEGQYIDGIAKLDPRLTQPVPTRKLVSFSFDEPDLDVFKNDLTPYTREKIMNALNAKDLPKEFRDAYLAEKEAEGKKGDSKKVEDNEII